MFCLMGRTAVEVETHPLQVPSGSSLTYCRLCFSTQLCKKIVSREDVYKWIEYIERNVGIEMSFEVDAPFAICLGCKATLESVDQFRLTCRMHDTALRQFRAQTFANSTFTSGESSVTAVTVDVPAETDDSEEAGGSNDSPSNRLDRNMCFACDLRMPSFDEYAKHMNKTHRRVGGFVPCPICPQRFRKDRLFQRHVILHTIGQNNIVRAQQSKKCKLCKEVFNSAKELGKHEEETHGFLFECRLCYRRFATKKDKSIHKLLHKAGKATGRTFTCKICSRVFPNRHCLSIHGKKHEKSFICWTCGTKYARLNEYAEHQTTVHQSKPIQDECIECNVVFNSKDEFAEHMETKHTAYDSLDVANDELSDSEGEQTNGTVISDSGQPGQSQLPELETVSVSSDDFPVYLDDDDGNDHAAEESTRRGTAITSGLEQELMLEEVPSDAGFGLYGTAFQQQISISLVEELSD